jgi:3-polyprenyl-4-hydroxybenzoate decarboxylase
MIMTATICGAEGVELDQARTPPISTSTEQSPEPRVLLSWCRVAPASSVTGALTTYLAQSLGSASRQARNQQQTNTARCRPAAETNPAVRAGRLENVFEGKDVNIEAIPTPIWHEYDGGPFIGTACLVVMKHPDSGWINYGTFRIQSHAPTNHPSGIRPTR